MRAVRASTVLLIPVLALGSCGLLFVTPFSTDVAQTLAVRDFSAEIDDPSLDEFRPFVLESGATELILLVGGQNYPADKPWLFVLKKDLSLAQAPFTRSDMNAIGSPFNGTRAMVDSQGRVVVGSVFFDIVDDTIAPVGPAGNLRDEGGLIDRGFPLAAAGSNIANMGSSGLTLNWKAFDCSWGSPVQKSWQIRASGRNLWLRDVFVEPDPMATDVILAFEEARDPATDTSTMYFVKVPKNGFAVIPPSDLMDGALNYKSTTKVDLESSRMGSTRDGIVAYDHSSQSWIIFPFEAPDAGRSVRVGDISDDLDNQRVAWSYSGGYACVYDRRSRTLSKVAAWWK